MNVDSFKQTIPCMSDFKNKRTSKSVFSQDFESEKILVLEKR